MKNIHIFDNQKKQYNSRLNRTFCQLFRTVYQNYICNLKKKLLIVLFVTICFSLTGTTYYVSPGGKDSNPGTISQPFFTLNKAWTVIAAGDIIYMRGGIYSYTSQQNLTGKNGNSGNLIKVWAYPGEVPIISRAATWTFSNNHAGIYFRGNYCHFKGLKITGFVQKDTYVWMGLYGQNFNNCIFELLDIYNNGLGSYMTGTCTGNSIINCDWHDNYDPLTNGDKYGNADGLNFENITPGGSNIINGCRFWNNSDDGLDLYNNASYLLIENCWSWGNGYREDRRTLGGDGDGFKLGGETQTQTGLLRTVRNCISFDNKEWAFNENGAASDMELYNNTSYNNGYSNGWSGGFHLNYPGIAYNIKNNISYKNIPSLTDFTVKTKIDHNSWNSGLTVSSSDFLSLDSTGVSGARGTNGELPVLYFLKLASGSALIDAGVDVGIPYDGNSPDLGAFEFQTSEPAPLPRYISSVIEDATPTLLEMTYDLTLNNLIVPSASAFSVQVNSVSTTVIAAAISGNKVQITLPGPAKFGDIITVSYTEPASNPLQTTSGGIAQDISTSPVTNNCKNVNIIKLPPVVVINSPKTVYAGFINEIDATATYDPNNDPLVAEWVVPNDVPVSTVSGLKTHFLAPVVDNPIKVDFQLKVSNGDTLLLNNITNTILPYKPELNAVTITNVEASDFQLQDYPYNILDGNTLTKWSSNGDNKWLYLKFAEPFKISHIELAFLRGQQFESYFDIYASKDDLIWDPILTGIASCNFSGERQIFDFPSERNNTEYLYLKYIGHGNSLNSWNYISEFKVFGSPVQNSGTGTSEKRKVIIYPNPASDFLNISIKDPVMKADMLRIVDISGKIVSEKVLNPIIKNVQIPIKLRPGTYYIDLAFDNITLLAQKIIVIK